MNYQTFMKTPSTDEGCALFYKRANETKYHILLPLETIPTLQGDREELEYTYTTMASTGKIKGRLNANTATTDFYWHRDIVNKLAEIKDEQVDLLVVLPDWQGYLAKGEVAYNYNDISAGELVKGKITIIPSWIDDEHKDNVKDLVMNTAMISNSLPTSITVSKAKTAGDAYELVLDPTNATVAVAYHSSAYASGGSSSVVTATAGTVTNGKCTLTIKAGTSSTVGSTDIVKVTISGSGVASDSTYVYVTIVA